MHLAPLLPGDDIKILTLIVFMSLYIFILKRFKFRRNITPWITSEVYTITLPVEENRCKDHFNKALAQQNYSFWDSLLLGKRNLEIHWNPQDDRHFIISEKWGKKGGEIEGHIKNYQHGNTSIEIRFRSGLHEQMLTYIGSFSAVIAFFLFASDGQFLFGILVLCVAFIILMRILTKGAVHMQERYRELLPLINSVK
jgi:hypothetical protein